MDWASNFCSRVRSFNPAGNLHFSFITFGTSALRSPMALCAELDVEPYPGQSAPRIETLSDDELLVKGRGEWLIVDFSQDPPATMNVLTDILEVDVRFTDEVSATG